MARKSRRHQLQDEIAYHLINRGNRKLDIFHSDEDYEKFLELLIRYKENRGLIIYHYCLMPNHYHLEAEIENPEDMSSIMAGINRAYTAYYHKRYNTSGYLWQGRFKSIAIEKEEYMLRCGRYIERNPVKSNIVQCAEDYKYSSARYYSSGVGDKVLTRDKGYDQYGSTEEERRANYRQYLAEYNEEDAGLFGGDKKVIGTREFMYKMSKKNGRLVPARQGGRRSANTFVS